jgi:RNA polymerase sigma-B factor
MPEPYERGTRSVDIAQRTRLDRQLFDRRDHGDPRARDELIERFLPLARSIALRYDKRGEPMEDLMQVASMALVKAVDRFDPERGTAFSSYAVPTIAGEIKRYFRDRTWAVRPPRDLQELVLRVDRMAERLETRLNRAPTVRELADALGECEEHVLDAMQARGVYSALSLHAARGGPEDGLTLQDELGEWDCGFEVAESRAVVARLMRGVSRRDRMVLRLRFEMDLTQAEIGSLLGVSQMQVSRILRQALKRLREVAEHDPADVVGSTAGAL